MQKQTTFRPPQAVRNAARRGLELRRRFRRGGLSRRQASTQGIGSGVQRAANLAGGDGISLSTIRRMRAFFERHERNYRPDARESDGGPTAGTIAWLLWGGTPGRRWANGVLRREGELEKLRGDTRWAPSVLPSSNPEARHKALDVRVNKVDDRLGIVFGYAIVCQEGGHDYYDTQGDFIPEDSMLRACANFMAGPRTAKAQHAGGRIGQVVFGYPLTKDIADALGVTVQRTGFVVGMKPDSREMLDRFANGEFTGFSIGGRRIADTDMDEDDIEPQMPATQGMPEMAA